MAEQAIGSIPVKVIDRKHPDYAAKVDVRENLRLLFTGGEEMKVNASRLLRQRPREDSDVYSARCNGLTYNNILATGVEWYTSAMFETPPGVRFWRKGEVGTTPAPDNLLKYVRGTFLNNCDLVGRSFIDFFRRQFEIALVHGAAHTLIDLPRRLVETETLAQDRELGYLNPYLASYTPQCLINWSCDAAGRYEWIVLRRREIRQTSVADEPKMVTQWFLYDEQEYFVYELETKANELVVDDSYSDKTAKLVVSGRHALAEEETVPLVTLTLMEGLWIGNQVYLQLLDHMNQDNTLAWALFMSNLAIPVIIGDVDTTNMTESEAGHLQFPAGTQYAWTEPAGKSFVHSANRIESLREDIYRNMHLQAHGRSMRATPAMQSGRSKTLEMRPAQEMMSGMGRDLKESMTEVVRLVCAASRDMSEVEPSVDGLNFAEEMTTEEVFAANSTLTMQVPSETMERFLYRTIVTKVMRTATDAERQQAYREVETGLTFSQRMEAERRKRLEEAAAGVRAAVAVKTMPNLKPGRGSGDVSPRPGGQPKGKR